ncbi:MAG: molecular chaperone HtpG [Oscillospiraceae bacterium]|nr:molecular chaperone HtpG [Oscillospiraceae bacterium]
MAKKQFKAESKRLLDLMINSIYTNREIFLREIISNASDAIDKLCYAALTDDKIGLNRDDFRIDIKVDPELGQITVSDNGIGMTAAEMEQNLGVIAKSGSLQFKKDNTDTAEKALDIIGQFGVGFYSAFMIASKVTVVSRAYGEAEANIWESTGADGYTIKAGSRDTWGTDVIMTIKEDTEEAEYSEYLDNNTLSSLVKKYSDYVRWPIYMDVTKSRYVETEELKEDGTKKKEWQDYTENEVINSRVPIWQRPKNEVTEDDCKEFYKKQFYDFEDPAAVIRVSAEGTVSYKAMLFVPAAAPNNYYSKDYEAGLQLYSSGVMIMEHCDALLPDQFRFVRGVVESPDLSLNISRELLQHDRQLKVIANSIEKKIRNELLKLVENDREKYTKFYQAFGLQFKYAVLNAYGGNKDQLQDLLMFWSAEKESFITLKDYTEAMGEDQKFIYFAAGESVAALSALPQTERIRAKGYDILLLTDNIDEFLMNMLTGYGEKSFCSVNAEELGLEPAEEKQKAEGAEAGNKELLTFVKEALEGKLAACVISHKLVSGAVCLTTQGGISLEMERYFASLPEAVAGGQVMKAERVLEINPDHEAFASLKKAFEEDREKAADYARLLYGMAVLAAGIPLEDTAEFNRLLCKLMK